MRDKFKVIIVVVTVLMFFCIGKDVFADRGYGSATYYMETMDTEFEYFYTSEYEKYIGIYYSMYSSIGSAPASMSLSPTDKEKLERLRSIMLYQEVDITEYELKFLVEYDNGTGSLIKSKYTKDELDKLCEYSDYYKNESIEEFQKKTKGTLTSNVFLQKGVIYIRDNNTRKVIAQIPHYFMCTRNPWDVDVATCDVVEYIGGTKELEEDVAQIFESNYNFKNNLNPYYKVNNIQTSDTDFWGDASSWFGEAQGSYDTPEQVDNIIRVFTDMINVVGTTVIVVATIVLGIKYIIGTVESQTAAKEGLITLLVACVFFFGWTSISNLLYGGDKMDFIFTSSSDTSYTNMVGRLFATFSYIAQFIVVGAIIYVGIKYIFAGASGRAELKGKSVYFIIGIILVFATSNVLNFVSEIINDTI